jgi:hypothetical protein
MPTGGKSACHYNEDVMWDKCNLEWRAVKMPNIHKPVVCALGWMLVNLTVFWKDIYLRPNTRQLYRNQQVLSS